MLLLCRYAEMAVRRTHHNPLRGSPLERIFHATILVILTISNTGRKWLGQGPDRGITVIEIFRMAMARLATSIRISLSNTKLRDRS